MSHYDTRERALEYLIHTVKRLEDHKRDRDVTFHDIHKVEGAAINLAKVLENERRNK